MLLGYLAYDTAYSLACFPLRSGAVMLAHHLVGIAGCVIGGPPPPACLTSPSRSPPRRLAAPWSALRVAPARREPTPARHPVPVPQPRSSASPCFAGLADVCTGPRTDHCPPAPAGVYFNKLALFGMAIEVFFESCNPLLHVSRAPRARQGLWAGCLAVCTSWHSAA